jgi:hypothetical protein
VPTVLQAKMAQQGKQMIVCARKGFAYHSVKLVLLANGNRYELDSNTFLSSDKAHYPLTSNALSSLTFFDTHLCCS